MPQPNYKINWKAFAFIIICSSVLGGIIDQLLQFNNKTFLISGYLPIVMLLLYYDYVTDLLKGINIIKPKLKGFINKWRHRSFSFIVFLTIIFVTFALIACSVGMKLYEIDMHDNRLYLVVSSTVILVATGGDYLLRWLYKTFDLVDALESKQHFFNQNMAKMLIYFSYLILIFVTNCGIRSESSQLWINTFATFIAFERLWKFWQEQNTKKEELTTPP